MAVQQVLGFGWLGYFWTVHQDEEIGLIIVSFACVYWMVMGSLMIGEYPQLSPRVKRELPQSFLGRMALTWFIPGSGTGYIFAVQNLGALIKCVYLMMFFGLVFEGSTGNPRFYQTVWFMALAGCYVDAYLGVTRLVVLLVRQKASVGIVFSLLVTILFVVSGAVGPWLFQFWLFDYRNEEYTELQMTNWFWTLGETMQNGITDHPLVLTAVGGTAAFLRLLNLALCGREVSQVRISAPRRVLEEDAAKLPAFKPRKNSPWDDEDEPLEAELPPGG
jgi:hypothetical protein